MQEAEWELKCVDDVGMLVVIEEYDAVEEQDRAGCRIS